MPSSTSSVGVLSGDFFAGLKGYLGWNLYQAQTQPQGDMEIDQVQSYVLVL